MCEILVLDTEQSNIETAQQVAATFHEEQGHGLGVLAVHDNGDSFSYDTYKSTNPHWATLYSFLRRNWNEAWRIVIHGRYATAGEVNRQNAHPLHVDCDLCDFDYVVHNGSVRNHGEIRGGLAAQGHEINTPVDSEIIAHKVNELPDTVQNHKRTTYSFRGNLNYLLFSEDGIFARVSRKYHLDDDFTMTCRPNDLDDFNYGNTNEWMIVEPGGETETKNRTSWGNTKSSGSKYTSAYVSGNNSRATTSWTVAPESTGGGSSGESSSDTFTVEYRDLLPNFDRITCIRLADGILRLIDHEEHDDAIIKRSEEPRVYYHYAPEPVPDNADFEELGSVSEPEQETVENHIDEETQESLQRLIESEGYSESAAEDIAEDVTSATAD